MAHKYDEFYRNLCDAKVVTATSIREAERLGLTTTLDELKHCYGVMSKIANNVMAKIESAHVADLMERQDERRHHVGGIPTLRPEEVPTIVSRGQTARVDPDLSPSQMMNALMASGLNPIVIDENTDFDALTRQLNLKESNDDSCAAPAEGHSTSAAADAACEAPVPEAPQGGTE